MEYIRGSGAPECIFHNKHKTLYNLFSPDPAVSCVADTQTSRHEIYILCSILLHFILEYVILFLAIQMGQMDFISSIFLNFCKIIWEIFH